MDDKITFFGETDARGSSVRFGIKAKDRVRHVYVIGKTGMGKSTLLENMAIQDIQNGEGIAFLDPHGNTAELLLRYVPQHRIKDVIYFAPFDMEYPISFNVLEDVGPDKRHLVAAGLMSIFKRIWADAWSARMEYILNNTLLALLEFPGATLVGVNRMLSDKDYRKAVVDNVRDPSVRSFWVDEFAKYNEKYMQEAGDAIKNKIGQFTANPVIRNIIGQPHSSFDLRKVMDEKKILIVNLSKGRIGESNANLLGGMIVTKIYLAAMSRADVSKVMSKDLPNFYLFVDEFQSFTNDSFADILSEARKYKLNLTIAHQYIEQMSDVVKAAVFGNVGTMITFRVGATDAEFLEKEFSPYFTAEDLVSLGMYQVYLKLMIDGVSSKPFSARTMKPIPEDMINYRDDIIETSRKQFSMSRDIVDKSIRDWHALTFVEKKEKSPRDVSREMSEKVERKGLSDKDHGKSFAGRLPENRGRSGNGNHFNVDRNNHQAPRVQTNHFPVVAPVPAPKPVMVEEDHSDGFVSLDKVKVPVVEKKIEESPKSVVSQSPAPAPILEKHIQHPPHDRMNLGEIKSNPATPNTNTKPNFGGKKATQEGMNDLKALLQSVIKQPEPAKTPAESIKANRVQEVVSSNTETKKTESAQVPQKPEELKEIPEETLKKVLDIKE